MDEGEELRYLRSRIRSSAHEMCNTLGIALNYLDFLGEDIAGTDDTHPIWRQLAPIQGAIRTTVDTVRGLRDDAVLAEESAVAKEFPLVKEPPLVKESPLARESPLAEAAGRTDTEGLPQK